MATELVIGAVLVLSGFLLGYVVGKKMPPGVPKPKKKKIYVCPHGKITKQELRLINGEEMVLCDFCYKNKGGENGETNYNKFDLPRL